MDLNPEHAHVLSEVRRHLDDTIGPFREEVRVGLAVHGQKIDSLGDRIDANDETTQRIGERVDKQGERIATLEGSESGKKSAVTPGRAGVVGAVTALVAGIGAALSEWAAK